MHNGMEKDFDVETIDETIVSIFRRLRQSIDPLI